ncbi:hypothetical protein M404DRAFT_539711 [Pisolithus tinctorius Marx 270]|uniref:Uncharacterized protein n=1 Tax=Pisolithus tinctorius Marx 270 TaxID=870435 RepID=A0A0C3K5B6_PISTI|nr:hypothetical protein M404DRAFT_539711 [Pisolithus tinctorius Marx 270]
MNMIGARPWDRYSLQHDLKKSTRIVDDSCASLPRGQRVRLCTLCQRFLGLSIRVVRQVS